MKTLNEVIKAFECCDHGEPDSRCEECPYNGIGACCAEREADALHYLTELQKMTDIPMEYFENGGTSQKLRNTSQFTCPKCHSEFVILDDPDGDHQQLLKCQALLQDFYRNDPLAWSELQQMKGKPVYVIYHTFKTKGWALVDYVDDDRIDFALPSAMRLNLFEHQLGKIWQAYRKERT